MKDILQRIHDFALEDVMGDRFGRYAKSIIQDRAIPDVRDGLKPVQRRILYGMYKERNTFDKPYRKSAKTVGSIMGNYHPHGDASIYDAMVRMSQWWKQNTPYIDMQGNNGSMDGDSAAAMRYTEARLSKISIELLKDIDKDTITWAPNFDDTEMEPTVLPAKFPNLLVNGGSGISAGYATNIPPHNLGEVIDATIKRIDSPNSRIDTILGIIKGPDFPTGGIGYGKKGIIDAFTTGRGKVIVRAKMNVVKDKGKEQIVITEIPFDVNKLSLVKKIEDIRIDKKIDGMAEVRDESDRNGLRIVIDLKKDANRQLVESYLLKNTDLQTSYNYNMVAIVNKRPMTLGVIPILDAYITHQKEFITRRTEFDLRFALARKHIVEGLIKAISILDEVIATIRASKNRKDAENNLVLKYDFTAKQAEKIVELQLYKLTNTDIITLEEENKNLDLIITALKEILDDDNKLKDVMKKELLQVKKEYACERKTQIEEEIEEIKIDTKEMIAKEDVIVVITSEGYVKRISQRSYSASSSEDTTVKEGDYVTNLYRINTLDTILLFTDLGNYLYVPVYELPDLKWKELGKHISNIIKIEPHENVIAAVPVYDFNDNVWITMFTKNGMVKRTLLKDFAVQRYSKPLCAMKLKKDDLVVSVSDNIGNDVIIATNNGYLLKYDVNEIPISGTKTSGVKAISLKDDFIVSGLVNQNNEYLTIITRKSTGKRIKINDLELGTRTRKGNLIIRNVKTNPYYILDTFLTNSRDYIAILHDNVIEEIKTSDLPISDLLSTGTTIIKNKIDKAFLSTQIIDRDSLNITPIEEIVINKEEVLDEVDKKIMTIDDFLDDFKV
ncbi:MAG: DNA topoisomerase IV subunit A [Bacilli bacterium]|nr:DNA topoisomerase IV subunit A [Bacilli bacterium]